ncbi:MAG: LytTR family DNA-binding domain-containing protein [Bacteroidales bacterium]|nr:LytTR family DNA-binding domain-containing protein [Bacteroidales bacterium]
MDTKLNQFITNFKKDLTLFFSISLGIFLFVLFFQPFWPEYLNYNNKLIFVAGLGAIVFIVTVLVRILLPFFMHPKHERNPNTGLLTLFENFLLLALSSVAFAFYLRYVGLIDISFPVMLKVVFICLVPPVVLGIVDKYKNLAWQQEQLRKDSHTMQKQFDRYKEASQNKTIAFVAENNTEKLEVLVDGIVFIKSADNYVELRIKEENKFSTKLIRNTLKNIELQLQPYSFFIRCHRTSIVNTHYIKKLKLSDNNYALLLNDLDDEIPVSRQYLLKIREVI